MRQFRYLLDLVINYMFSPTETQYYSMKGQVSVRSNALMPTDPAQHDDDPQVTSAGESGARNICSTNS